MQKLNLNSDKDDRDLIMGRLKKIFSSSHINLLLGSAFSLPFLETLNNIEIDLSKAVESGDIDEEYKLKKSFFDKSILPIQTIAYDDKKFYEKNMFIKTLCDILNIREAANVHKRLNIFTTNYDNLIEVALERNNIDYFDGFGGRINPEFSTINYGKVVSRQTELTGRVSEIITVNLYKLHGSIYWKQKHDKIYFDDFKDRFQEIKDSCGRDEFLKKYRENLFIVNPEKSKFNSTVLNSNYYDQIRMFANELEKRNSILLVYGFSFSDEHIYQIISRALNSNPTLTLILFPYNKFDMNKFEDIFTTNNVYAYHKLVDGVMENFELNSLNLILEEIYNGIK